MKPWMKTRSRVLRPSREDSKGRSDCVEEDLGSSERHWSATLPRPLSLPEEGRGFASSLLRRGGKGDPLLGGTSREGRGEVSWSMAVGQGCKGPAHRIVRSGNSARYVGLQYRILISVVPGNVGRYRCHVFAGSYRKLGPLPYRVNRKFHDACSTASLQVF